VFRSMGSLLPKISLVTPSFNQTDYLRHTLESVIRQNYPNLEYIVLDGGSTDGSLEVIRSYEDKLTFWRSKPDGGQYEALNEGFARATGDIMAWLNSDDIYFPWTLSTVARIFSKFPNVSWLSGAVCFVNQEGQVVATNPTTGGLSGELTRTGRYRDGIAGFLPQEGMFWRRELWDKAGGFLDTRLKLAADFELWCRFARHTSPVAVRCLLAGFRRHCRTQRSMRLRPQYSQEVSEICVELGEASKALDFVARNKVLGALYRLLFTRGESWTVRYDDESSDWVLERCNGRLYRLSVMRRSV
jgi:hypothetical protein